MKGAATKARMAPEEMEQVVSEAMNNGRPLGEIFDGEYLIGNTSRVQFDNLEELYLHGEYAVRALEKTLKGKGVETFGQVLKHTQEWLESMSLQGLVEAAAHDKATMRNLTVRAMAYKIGAKSAGQELIQLKQLIDLHGKTPELAEQFEKTSKLYQDLSLSSKDIITTGGRIITQGRVSPGYMDADMLAKIIQATDGNPERVLKVLSMTRAHPAGAIAQEAIINGLLSSPKTHLVNIAGNALKTLLMPAEKMLDGAISGNDQMVREGAAAYSGMRKYFTESLKMAKVAWETGDNILDSGHKINDLSKQPMLGTYEKIRQGMLDRKLAGGKSAELSEFEENLARAGAFLGWPSRALVAMDEAFKQLNYRSNMYAKLMEEGTVSLRAHLPLTACCQLHRKPTG
jgi:hypothetical protein